MYPTQRKEMISSAYKNKGFSLFELIVYILLVSTIFSVSMRRFGDFPEEAERANFLAITGQIKAAVNLQMMKAIAGGNWENLAYLENSNPMDLMLEAPSNYAGAYNPADEQSLSRRTWYFDSVNGQLVYLASDSSHLFSTQGDGISSIRFRIAQRYAEDVSGGGRGQKWQGLVLEEVTPFDWQRAGISLPDVEIPQ